MIIDPCMEDEEIIRTAILENRMVVTMDYENEHRSGHPAINCRAVSCRPAGTSPVGLGLVP